MKTAEEIRIDVDLARSNSEAIYFIKQYAKQVAEQALKDAAENATTISKYGDEGMVSHILETEIKLP